MGADLRSVEHLLDTFDELVGTDGEWPWAFSHRGGEFPLHVVLGAIVHGNENGTLPAVVDLVRGLTDGDIEFGGDLTVVLGNPDAARAGKRFLDTDLNRSFGPNIGDGRERTRATEITPILRHADLFFDLHQTTEATDRPFYIGPFRDDLWRWASALAGATTWVTRAPDATFSSAGMCADEFVRDLGLPGLTLEVGQAGMNPESDACTRAVLDRLIDVATTVGRSGASLPGDPGDHPDCLLYTSPSPRDATLSRMPSSA